MAKFTFTIETENEDELTPYLSAVSNQNLLWELQNNFWRRWKYSEGSDDYIKGVQHVLDELNRELLAFKGEVE